MSDADTLALDEQPRPEESSCPHCGADPTDSSIRQHKLSNLGYLHDDQQLECPDGHQWMCGVPIGDPDDDLAADFRCDSCEEAELYVHRVALTTMDAKRWAEGELEELPLSIHLKCPNCYYFTKAKRYTDGERGIALMGHGPITGSREGAEPFGWSESESESETETETEAE